MSDVLGITIKVDAPQAKPTVDALEGSLAKVEARGPSVSAALTKGLAAGTASADKLGQSTKALAGPFDSLAAAIGRESAMLEKIQRPMKELEEGHQSLNSLLRQGSITAEQYTTHLGKLESAAGKVPKEGGGFHLEGSAAQAIGSRFGEGGSLLGGLASGGGLEMAGLVGLGAGLLEISDDYIKTANSARRLHDANFNVNDSIHQQLGLAGELHGSLEETMELSIKVKERTEDLNLTDRERLDLTRQLGEASILSGHSVGDAAGAFERLQFALDAGIPAGRALKTEFLQFPEIQKAMEEHLHMTTGALIALANQGKLTGQDVVSSLLESKTIAADFAKQGETTGQAWRHLYENSKEAIGEWMNAPSVMDVARGKMKILDGEIVSLDTHLVKAKDAWKAFTDGVDKGNVMLRAEGLVEMDKELDKFGKDLGAVLGVVLPKLQKDGIRGLVDPWFHGSEAVKEHHRVLSDTEQVMKDLFGPIDELDKKIAATEVLFAQGKLTVGLYNNALGEFMHKRDEAAEKIGLGATPLPSVTAGISIDPNQFALPESASASLAGDLTDKQRRYVDEIGASRGVAHQFAEEMQKLKEMGLPPSLEAEGIAKLRDRYDHLKTPVDEFRRAKSALDAEMQEGLISLEAENRELDALKLKLGLADWGTGIRQGFRDINEEAHGSAKEIEGAMKSAFDGVNDNLTAMITGQQTNWSKLASTIEADMVKASLHKIEAAGMDSLTGGATAAATQGAALTSAMTAGGTSAGGILTAAMTTGGEAAAAAIGTAMSAGAAESGAASGAGAGIGAAAGGAASGGWFDVPHAASGFAGIVRQQSGQDTHLAMFHVRERERVTIETPEQQAAAARGAGGAMPELHNHNHMTIQGIDDRSVAAAINSPHGTAAVFKLVRDNAGAFRAILQKG